MGRTHGDPFLVVGVTGGIGAGKSTVARLLMESGNSFLEQGARLLDADAISREATAVGQPAVVEITERFGESVLGSQGSLDRTALAAIVFSDPQARRDLEAIVHARVVEAMDAALAQARRNNWRGLMVLDVPIPVERGFVDVCDEIWVVVSSENQRLERVMSRSGLTREQVLERMSAQPGDDFWYGLADRIVQNDGPAEALAAVVHGLLQQACAVWFPSSFQSAETCVKVGGGDTLKPRVPRADGAPGEGFAMREPMFERDLLYPTDVAFEPGSVHIRVYAPDPDGRIPVHIEAKTNHNLIDHLESIMNVMQSDIFDRIRMDIRRSGTVILYPYDKSDVLSVRYAENGRTHTTKVVHGSEGPDE